MLNILYIFLNNFKETPKASEYTGLVISDVLSGVESPCLDRWLLGCGRWAGMLVSRRSCPPSPANMERYRAAAYGSHCFKSVNDILCMHISHVYYNGPENQAIGIAVNILRTGGAFYLFIRRF